MNSGIRDIRNYVRPSILRLLPAIFVGAFAVVVAVNASIIPALVCLLFALLLTINYAGASSRMKKSIEKYTSENGEQKLADDFAAATPAFNDRLRAGDEWLYGKAFGTIIRYDEIKRVYVYIHRTNGVEDQRALKVVIDEKNTVELCKIPTKGVLKKEGHDDLKPVVTLMLTKNPAIQVGYNK